MDNESLLVDDIIDPYKIAQDASHFGARVLKIFCVFCPFLRWSQMVLTRAKWPNVHCGQGKPHPCPHRCSDPPAVPVRAQWAPTAIIKTRRSGWLRKDVRPEKRKRRCRRLGSLRTVVEGISVEAETLVSREGVRQFTTQTSWGRTSISGRDC